MPVEIQGSDTINRGFKPRWQAQHDRQQLNGIIYSKGSCDYTTVSLTM